MERKAKRNCALSVRCRYVARQIHRSPGRGLLALLVAAVLLFGLCYLQESILSNQQEMERLYCTIEVGGRILPKDTASDAYNYGFLSHDVPEQLQETGFITDMVLESAINGVVYGKDKNGTLTGKEAATQIRGVSDLDRYAPVVDGTIMVHFLPNWGTENFSQMNNVSTDNASIYWVACPVLLSTTLCEMLEVQPGDLVNLDFLTAGGLCYICGSFTNNSTETANVLISQEMLDSIHELHEAEPTYLYTRCDFTLDPAQNFRINEFREVAEKLLAEDQKNRENQGIPGDETLFVLQDSELTQAIQPLEKNLSLMRLLYPITQAVAALVSAALAMLLLAQRAKGVGHFPQPDPVDAGGGAGAGGPAGCGIGSFGGFPAFGEAGPGDLLPDQPGAVPGRVSPGYHSGHSPRRKPQAPGATPGERMRRRTHDV